MMAYLIAALAVAILVAGVLWMRAGNWKRREAALRQLLDGADALEAQIQDYRSRMLRLKQVLTQLPSDMTATAMSSIEPEAQVHKALREVLAHRLWIAKEGQRASQRELDTAVSAMVRSRESLAQQLALLDDVGAQLAAAGAGLRSAYQEASAAMQLMRQVKERGGDDDAVPPARASGNELPPTRH